MKNVFLALLSFFAISTIASAQFNKGDFEISLSGTGGQIDQKLEYSYYSSSQKEGYLLLTVTPAYYIIKGLSIEADLCLMMRDDDSPAGMIGGNLSYSYLIPKSSIALFARAGYGVSNSFIAYSTNMLSRFSNSYDINVYNFGVGSKFVIGTKAFIKTELNYKIMTCDKSGADYTAKYLTFNVGVGLILPGGETEK